MTLADRKKLALEAAQEPWLEYVGPPNAERVFLQSKGKKYLSGKESLKAIEAAHIAACSPDYILKLIACIEAADADCAYDAARAALDATL